MDSTEETCKMKFNSEIVTIPGLTSSGPFHWQTLWEKRYGFNRIHQQNWDSPDCEEWINTIDSYLCNQKTDLANTLFIGHSLGCITIAAWAKKYDKKLKGALLVAPCDTEAEDFPSTTSGFTPIPLFKLSFPTILVLSSNDNYISQERSILLGKHWGSEVISIGEAGHINTASELGEWDTGLKILKKLDQ